MKKSLKNMCLKRWDENLAVLGEITTRVASRAHSVRLFLPRPPLFFLLNATYIVPNAVNDAVARCQCVLSTKAAPHFAYDVRLQAPELPSDRRRCDIFSIKYIAGMAGNLPIASSMAPPLPQFLWRSKAGI